MLQVRKHLLMTWFSRIIGLEGNRLTISEEESLVVRRVRGHVDLWVRGCVGARMGG